MDVDLAAPAEVAPGTRDEAALGARHVLAPVAVDAPVTAAPPGSAVPVEPGARIGADAPGAGTSPARLARVRAEIALADNQLLAAAQLVRSGWATRVTITNAAVDSGLPAVSSVRGTPVRLERLPDGLTRVSVGRRQA